MLFLAACGARTSTPTPAPRAQPAPAAAAPANPGGPTEADCDELLAHAIDVIVADRQPPPTEAERATIRSELRSEFIAECRAGTRAYQQCGLAARTRAELDACKP